MAKNQDKKMGKKGKIIIAIVCVPVVLVAAVAVIWFFLMKNKIPGNNMFSEEMMNRFESMGADTSANSMENVFGAYGTISLGTEEETFPVENMTATLEIEEVYVNSGDQVKEGTVLMRFTEDSVNECREELEATLRSADLEYRKGVIEYKESLITAKYTLDSTVLSGEQADDVYDASIASLKASYDKAKDELEDAKEQIAEYEDAKANDTYYTEYKVGYYKDIYDENLKILKDKMEEWGVAWQDVTTNQRNGAEQQQQYKYILSQLYKVLEQNAKDYESAQEKYDSAMADLDFNLQTLNLKLPSLEEAYAEAKQNYETQVLQAKLTKETSKSNASRAEKNYETNVEKAESDLEILEDALSDAQADMDAFNACIQDNCYVSQESGKVMRANLRAGRTVGAGTRMVTYQNTEDMTVSVSVSQDDIAKIKVGDSAIIYSSDSGMYSGIITELNPISQSTQMGSVTYTVTAKVTQTDTSLSANETVTVYFGMGGMSSER